MNDLKGPNPINKPVLVIISDESKLEDISKTLPNQTEQVVYVKPLSDSLENYILSLNGCDYSSIIILLNNDEHFPNGTDIMSFHSAVENGLNLIIQVPQLWKLQASELLGFSAINYNSQAEWEGETHLSVLDNTYFNASLEETLTLHGYGTFAHKMTTTASPLIDLLDNDEEQHLGIFSNSIGDGKVFTANFLVKQGKSPRLMELWNELLFNVIYNEYDTTSETIETTESMDTSTSTSPEGTLFSSQFLPELIMATVLISGTVGGSFALYSIVNKPKKGISSPLSKAKLSNIDDPNVVSVPVSESNMESSDRSLWGLLLAPFVALLILIQEPRLRKLSSEDILSNSTRQQVISLLERNSFEHFRELQRLTRAGVGALTWHLQVLLDCEVLLMKRHGQFKIYYLSDKAPIDLEIILYFALRSQLSQKIVKTLLMNPQYRWHFISLSEYFNTNKDSILYHCNKLHKLRIITFRDGFLFLNKEHNQIINRVLVHLKWNYDYLNEVSSKTKITKNN